MVDGKQIGIMRIKIQLTCSTCKYIVTWLQTWIKKKGDREGTRMGIQRIVQALIPESNHKILEFKSPESVS